MVFEFNPLQEVNNKMPAEIEIPVEPEEPSENRHEDLLSPTQNKMRDIAAKLRSSPEEQLAEMAARMRRMEQQHMSDKASWKLKFERSLAGIQQVSSDRDELFRELEKFVDERDDLENKMEQCDEEKEKLQAQVKQTLEEKEDLAKQLSQLTALQTKTVHAHNHEKTRLEAQVQKASAEWGLAMIKLQREHKTEVAQMVAQVKSMEALMEKKEKEHQKAVADTVNPLKSEREEFIRRLTAQRGQITTLKANERTVKDLGEQLAESHKKFSEANRILATSKECRDSEIKMLKKRLEASRRVEVTVPNLKAEVVTLKQDLKEANKREKKLKATVESLESKRKEHEAVIQKQDEELIGWKQTAEKLEKCVDELMNLEAQSADSYQQQIDTLLNKMRSQLEEANDKRRELEATCTSLRTELGEWKNKCTDVEQQLEDVTVIIGDRNKTLSDLCAKQKQQEIFIQKQQEDINDWKDAATKLENCVDGLMELERSTRKKYQAKLQGMADENFALGRQIQTMKSKNVQLSSEIAGLRMDDELGLESVYTFAFNDDEADTKDMLPTPKSKGSHMPLSPSSPMTPSTPRSTTSMSSFQSFRHDHLSPLVEVAEESFRLTPSKSKSRSSDEDDAKTSRTNHRKQKVRSPTKTTHTQLSIKTLATPSTSPKVDNTLDLRSTPQDMLINAVKQTSSGGGSIATADETLELSVDGEQELSLHFV